MNEKNYFTIVVPLSPDAQKIVQGNPSAVPLRAAVWSQAAERMKPLLGGVCSRFSPAVCSCTWSSPPSTKPIFWLGD